MLDVYEGDGLPAEAEGEEAPRLPLPLKPLQLAPSETGADGSGGDVDVDGEAVRVLEVVRERGGEEAVEAATKQVVLDVGAEGRGVYLRQVRTAAASSPPLPLRELAAPRLVIQEARDPDEAAIYEDDPEVFCEESFRVDVPDVPDERAAVDLDALTAEGSAHVRSLLRDSARRSSSSTVRFP